MPCPPHIPIPLSPLYGRILGGKFGIGGGAGVGSINVGYGGGGWAGWVSRPLYFLEGCGKGESVCLSVCSVLGLVVSRIQGYVF